MICCRVSGQLCREIESGSGCIKCTILSKPMSAMGM